MLPGYGDAEVLPAPRLTNLDLSSNKITSLQGLHPVARLSGLRRLSLRGNPVVSLATNYPFVAIIFLDLSSTLLPGFSSLNQLLTAVPLLTSLLTRETPMSFLPSARLQTIARIPSLRELNHSKIEAAERQNAEIFYLKTITEQLTAAANLTEEHRIRNEHPRWADLCGTYGEPFIPAKSKIMDHDADPQTLAARMIEFTFYIQASQQSLSETFVRAPNESALNDSIEVTRLIPKTVDTYRLKNIISSIFSIQPIACKLIWETGESDLANLASDDNDDDDDGWSVSEDDIYRLDDCNVGDRYYSQNSAASMDRNLGLFPGIVKPKKSQRGSLEVKYNSKWKRREVELSDGLREIGYWIEEGKARIRIEIRNKD